MPKISVNGYAYPFINPGILEGWLPSVTFISSFSYGFTANGEIVDLDDINMRNIIYSYNIENGSGSSMNNDNIADNTSHFGSDGIDFDPNVGVGVLMVLTPIDENGNFNSQRTSDLLNNQTSSDNLIRNILSVLNSKNMSGVDFDFEYIPPADRDLYTALVRKSREILNAEGYIVTVALAPKTSSQQKGLLYEGHDYHGMGQAANLVLLMTYEWGYTYSEPMAVAPYNQVRRVIEYGITEIPPDKIWMGMANYGYDWTLPYVPGKSRAEKISNPEAEARASRYNAVIRFNELAQTPFFLYTDEQGREHEVWFENAASWRAKLNLIPEFGLSGIGIWNVMDPFPQGIAVLNEMFTIKKAPV